MLVEAFVNSTYGTIILNMFAVRISEYGFLCRFICTFSKCTVLMPWIIRVNMIMGKKSVKKKAAVHKQEKERKYFGFNIHVFKIHPAKLLN